METSKTKWICVQLGAREHYAIPRALHRTDRLEALFTELWSGPVLRTAAKVLPISPFRAMAGRWHEELGKAQNSEQFRHLTRALSPSKAERKQEAESRKRKAEIISWNWQAWWRDLRGKVESREQKVENVNPYANFIRDGQWFSERVRDCLNQRGTDVCGSIIFSYDTTALELFRWAKERGAICVLGQMDPGRVESDLVREEEARWPGWAAEAESGSWKAESRNCSLEVYCRRREEEWRLADQIIVNSRWSFDALVKQGVPSEKLVVIPLCYEQKAETMKLESRNWKAEGREQRAESRNEAAEPAKGVRNQKSEVRLPISDLRPLKILFLGQVILRKGIQYLVEAARLLLAAPLRFEVVGPIGISKDAIKSAPRNVTFHGRVSRDQATLWYENSDVFVLPTLSDGFALTQLEAMAHGLPVITTPNCGEVVTDGVDGLFVAPRDAAGLAKAIERYLMEPQLLAIHRIRTQQKICQFTLTRLAEHLAMMQKTLHSD
jgi:glycosyltransferase involved in cell wall biosynthesis